jgi:hypothetical protein
MLRYVGKLNKNLTGSSVHFIVTTEDNSGFCGEVSEVELFIGLASVEVKQI